MQPFKLPPKISLARLPTPLRPLDRLSERYGGPRIWLKQDELTELGLSGNKVRKLEFVIADALEQGADTLITCGGVQSNHCRATALAGARLGLKSHLVLRGPLDCGNEGNLLLDNLAGAEISIYPGTRYVKELPQIMDSWKAHYAGIGRQAYVIPTGASNGTGLWGYLQAARETLEQCRDDHGFRPGAIVTATGSGGTQAGLTLGCHLFEPAVKVLGIAVCDSADYFNRKVKSDVEEWQSRYGHMLNPGATRSEASLASCISVHTLEDYIGPGYAKGYPGLFQTIAEAASLEGVILDPIYTGKAFHGMLDQIQKGVFAAYENIVFVHTGGFFGLFPYEKAFANRAHIY